MPFFTYFDEQPVQRMVVNVFETTIIMRCFCALMLISPTDCNCKAFMYTHVAYGIAHIKCCKRHTCTDFKNSIISNISYHSKQ